MAKKLYQINIDTEYDEGASATADDWARYKRAIIERVASFGGVDYVYPLTQDGNNLFATLCLTGTNLAELCFMGTGANTYLYFGACGKNIPSFTQPYISFKDFGIASWGHCKLFGATDDNDNLIALVIEDYGTSLTTIYTSVMFFYRDNNELTVSLNKVENTTVGSKYYSRMADIKCGNYYNPQSGFMYDFCVNVTASSSPTTPTGKTLIMNNIHSDEGNYSYYTRDYPVNMMNATCGHWILRQGSVKKTILVGEQKYFHFGGYQWMPYDTFVEENITIHISA